MTPVYRKGSKASKALIKSLEENSDFLGSDEQLRELENFLKRFYKKLAEDRYKELLPAKLGEAEADDDWTDDDEEALRREWYVPLSYCLLPILPPTSYLLSYLLLLPPSHTPSFLSYFPPSPTSSFTHSASPYLTVRRANLRRRIAGEMALSSVSSSQTGTRGSR
jgi:hypothetical protein